MKRLIAMLFGATVLFAAFGAAPVSAAPKEDQNAHGICTAYFNGQKNGHTSGESPGPFGTLEDDAGTYDGTNSEDSNEMLLASDVLEYCNSLGVVVGGNPEHNGRYDCSNEAGDKKAGAPRDGDTDGEFECTLQD